MTRSLCISVTFLLGRYHGRTEGDQTAEWPPSPLRLFQALVAAAYRGRGESPLPEAEESALRWLEELCEQRPPLIVDADSQNASAYVIAVPNNDLDVWARPLAQGREPKKQPAELRTMKAVRPTATLDPLDAGEGDASAHFLWPLADEHEPTQHKICQVIGSLVRRIIALGWGTDLVAAEARLLDAAAVAKLRGVRWRPLEQMPDTHSNRPVPVRGTLDALRARHKRWLGRVNSKGKEYDHVRPFIELDEREAPRRLCSYVSEGALPTRPVAVFALCRTEDPEKFHAFPADGAAKVAAMLRHAACKASQADKSHAFPGGSECYVAGHGAPRRGPTPPRFSYLPLPSVTGLHPDGMIRRVLVAEPFGGDGAQATWAASRLHGTAFFAEGATQPAAVLERIDRWSCDKVLPAFIGPARGSREWMSVTPVVLPGYDGLDVKKAAMLFSRACDQAGLPQGCVESFEFVGPPRWGSGRFFVPKYLRGWPLRNMRLRFHSPVRGPIALGAGRHCGLGVFAIDLAV